jgi:hypothetical protein
MKLNIPVFSLLLFVQLGCNKEVVGPYDCTSALDIRILPNDLWQELTTGQECSIVTDPSSENIYVVRTPDQYSFFVSCIDGPPLIDFEKYTLLVGSRPFDDEVVFKEQSILKDCGQQKYIYTIAVDIVSIGTPSVLYFTTLVPVMPDNYTAEVQFLE